MFSPRQSKELRSLDQTIPFELSMVKGGFHDVEKRTVRVLSVQKGCESIGVEVAWPETSVQLNNVRMAVSDDYGSTLAELTFATIEQHVRRHLTFSHGLPRRQVLLLDGEEGTRFMEELKTDAHILSLIQELDFDGHEMYMVRSVFTYTSVKQLIGCLVEEGWSITPRTLRVESVWPYASEVSQSFSLASLLSHVATKICLRAGPYILQVPRLAFKDIVLVTS